MEELKRNKDSKENFIIFSDKLSYHIYDLNNLQYIVSISNSQSNIIYKVCEIFNSYLLLQRDSVLEILDDDYITLQRLEIEGTLEDNSYDKIKNFIELSNNKIVFITDTLLFIWKYNSISKKYQFEENSVLHLETNNFINSMIDLSEDNLLLVGGNQCLYLIDYYSYKIIKNIGDW